MRHEARCLRLDFNVGRARSKFVTFATKTSKTTLRSGTINQEQDELLVYHTYTNLNILDMQHFPGVGCRAESL